MDLREVDLSVILTVTHVCYWLLETLQNYSSVPDNPSAWSAVHVIRWNSISFILYKIMCCSY